MVQNVKQQSHKVSGSYPLKRQSPMRPIGNSIEHPPPLKLWRTGGAWSTERKPFLLTHKDEFPYTPPRLKQVLITSPMREPTAIIGSDAILGSGLNKVHPRMIGTFARVPGKVVAEDGVRLGVRYVRYPDQKRVGCRWLRDSGAPGGCGHLGRAH